MVGTKSTLGSFKRFAGPANGLKARSEALDSKASKA